VLFYNLGPGPIFLSRLVNFGPLLLLDSTRPFLLDPSIRAKNYILTLRNNRHPLSLISNLFIFLIGTRIQSTPTRLGNYHIFHKISKSV
ncbi:unnamed protein product, partial [Arabidopsis halleri]